MDTQEQPLHIKLETGTHCFCAPNGLIFTYTVRSKLAVGPTANNKFVLVQCPGWGLGSRYLQIGLSPLEETFVLIYFQPRGSPGSSRPADSTKMGCFDMARDLDFFRQWLDIHTLPALLGHSHGGSIALAYAELFPNNVEKLLLIDHRLRGYDDSASFLRFRELRAGDARFEDAYRIQSTHGLPQSDDEMTSMFIGMLPLYFFSPEKHLPAFLDDAGLGFGFERISAWCYNSAARCDKAPEMQEKMRSELDRVTARVMMIFGNEDAVCSIENICQTQLHIKHAESLIINECGHFPWVEKPVETLDAMKQFLLS